MRMKPFGALKLFLVKKSIEVHQVTGRNANEALRGIETTMLVEIKGYPVDRSRNVSQALRGIETVLLLFLHLLSFVVEM